MLLLPLAAAPSVARAQSGTDIVRGRVLGPDDRPLPNTLVVVTGVQTQAVRETRTNDEGRYTVLFADGEGDYVVEVRAVGFAPRSVRVTREGDESILLANVDLARAAVQLDPVTTTAQRGAPRRGVDPRSIGGLEQDVLRGALFSLDPGDLTELAASVPGVLAVVGADGDTTGFSVLGAPADQNNVVVDGSTFEGGSLPPDALAGARLVTTSFDPGRGQFAGGQLTASTRGGSDFVRGNLRADLSHPELAWADPSSGRAVPLTRGLRGSIGGPIRKGKAHYFAALDVRQQSTDAFSLLAPHGATLDRYGLSRDTIDAFAATLRSLGVPLTTGAIPDDVANDRQSAFLRFDLTPTATTSLTIRADGAWTQRGGSGASALSFPTLGAESGSRQVGLQVSGSAYLAGFVDEFRTYVQRSSSSTAPYVSLPTGNVRVGVERDDGATGLTSLRFGGGSAGGNERESTKWETRNELSWIDPESRHRLKLGQSVTLERSSTSQEADQYGSFTYASLEDLAANHPASYTRTLAARQRSTSAVSGALWVGDEWRVATGLRFQYGLRLDAARPTTTPAHNPEIEELFGVRTDRVPRDVGYSPRLGFSWSPWAPRMVADGGVRGRPRPAPARGAGGGRARAFEWWRFLNFSGGIGAFRGVIPPSRIASLVDATGLPNSTLRLACVGEATPVPEWDVPGGAAFDTCLDGTAPAGFSSAQPSVQVFAPSYQAPVSWRGNLGVHGLSVRGWRLGVNGTYSLGLNGESGIDLNLRRTPVFSLPDEDGRPVFVDEQSIVPTTGAVAPGASRLTSEYGRVTSIVSDLRSTAAQLDLSLFPPRPLFGKIPLNASYTWSRQRSQERGFQGTTAGDPFAREWAEGQQPTHQFRVSTSASWWWLGLSLRLDIRSGTAYTPRVAGDVNGDGAGNDRAFVFDPATAADPALAAEMDALLATTPDRARECLLEQMGRIAERNACRTGWQLRPDVNLSLRPPRNIGYGDRLRFSVTTQNAGGALFRLLGLSDTPLGRSATPAAPDATLLYVTGFDPATRRYEYRVNQQFGDARTSGRSGRRFTAPFQVQLGLEYTFGGPPRNGMSRRFGLVPADGEPPLTADELRLRLRRLSANPVDAIMRMSDTLRLTGEQVARMRDIGDDLDARLDSLSAPLARWILERKGKIDDQDLVRQLAQLRPAMMALMVEGLDETMTLLTPEQRELVPDWLRMVIEQEGGRNSRGRPRGRPR